MAAESDEVERRKQAALAAVKRSYGTKEAEHSTTLFVSHHLEELDSSYWQQHLGTESPTTPQILDLLELRSHWGDSEEDEDEDDEVGDGLDVFDFTLPGDVTDYVLSVRFDEKGGVENISMES